MSPWEDGSVHAMTCDPCDDTCDPNEEVLMPVNDIRILYGNDTSPWYPGEGVRIRVRDDMVNEQLEFDCTVASGIPDVCQNMCYGIYCANHPATLTKNTANKQYCADARKRNSCGVTNPNRCSTRYNPPFPLQRYSCDEYPFASSLEGQQAGVGGYQTSVTRCVPARQNSVQGGKISAVYRKMQQNDQMDINFDFGIAGPDGYCAATRNCAVLVGTQQAN
ncbi:hypothetical protein DENSPDRAFT_7955 [Dentipellis sp. KUC8613]|nr:hypothetical protein DENSPDRAFT_7955 [Dentipellis sp. KUC8613]